MTTPAEKLTDKTAAITKNVCKRHKLTKAETLQVLNIAPSSEVEIHLIVEEAEERLDPVAFLEELKAALGSATKRVDV
ncbi:hypothetical protein SAMD00019534_117910 [Acytostelium subglobosum LB1]|uniref:hypothetical protein n=1 Tax=Acytostelium subglobosum LB1 TaxID=1410327 RepID=UPI000645237B|nr:hypothetical protein SAMD00019534_117910 [Acytostelium subglobosum LB1]GAM28615.1 hypothetical protein SAMD00019534_117910 [Acytostelium subglobosum LB1]|eukprot:XP_012748393.1 hypothetical protein SAMD00019534_117910 [Acytostelium subglobosum LB1]